VFVLNFFQSVVVVVVLVIWHLQ